MSRRSESLDRSSIRSTTCRLGFNATRSFLSRESTLSEECSKPVPQSSSSGPSDFNLLSEADLANVASILPHNYLAETVAQSRIDLSWYSWWVREQTAQMPQNLWSILPTYSKAETAQAFMSLWNSMGSFLSQNPGSSIDDIVEHLQELNAIKTKATNEHLQLSRSFIFSVIGWQTMLFRADCGSCPTTIFAIADEMNGYRGRVHMRLKHPQSSSRESMDKCLLGFGVLLPPRNYDLSNSSEHKSAFNQIRELSAANLNASLLVHVGRMELRWTDCLACHLELDLSTNCVYLFRYPSFCVANRIPGDEEKQKSGPLHSCCQQREGNAMWAKYDEVSDLLEEILISYRLLFGQHKESRKLFRNMSPFEGRPIRSQDRSLTELCGRKRCSEHLVRADRKNWDLKHDFPILRSRLSTLAYEMSIRKPRTWSELWKDKRDSAQWATFWIVLIFGMLSIFLTLIQVILQAVQLGTQ